MQSTVRRRLADHIWQWRKVVYVASAGLSLLVLVGVFLSISLPDTIPELSTEPTFFDGSRAYRAAQELAAESLAGDPEGRGAESAAWLRQRLDDLNIPYSLQTFTARLGYEEHTLENLVVVLPGQTSEALLVSAPRGDRLDPTLSPIASAAGSAILLDLIQVFLDRPHEKTLVFLSSEGAQFGGLGLGYYLDHPGETDVESILSVSRLGKEGRESLQGAVTGGDRSTPGWYVQLTSVVLATADLRLELPGLADQVGMHALGLANGEQVAGLERDVPSLSLFDEQEGTVSAEGLATQGAVLERLLLTLDGGAAVPTAAPAALVLPSGRFLTLRGLTVLGYVMLLPTAVMALTWLAVIQIRPESWLRYLRNAVSFFLPPALWLGAAALAAYGGLLPRYPVVAPPGAAAATEPRGIVTLALVVGGVLVFVVIRHFLGYLRPREPAVMAEMSKLASGLLVLLGGLILLATHSVFSLLTALTAAWLWPLASCFFEPKYFSFGRWPHFRTNAWLLLLGLAAPVALYVFLVVSTPVGWANGWWYLLVQTVSGAYGFSGPLAFALLAAGFLLLLGVKRLRLLPVDSLESARQQAPSDAPPRVRRIEATEPGTAGLSRSSGRRT